MTPSNEKERGTRKHNYIDLSIREVFEKCNLETPVYFDGDYFISPTPILSIRFPKVIYDGSKRKVFRKVIHDFMTLNPDFTISHVYLFINHINENFAKPKMEPGLLKKVVESQFDLIKSQDDYLNKSKKTLRSIHYLNKGAIPSVKKKGISSRFRGMMERYLSFQRVQHARNFLYDEHGDCTYQQIADLLGLSIRTVKRHVKLKKEDFEREYRELMIQIEKEMNIN
jgi:AraC-like DNA-binding protein